MSKRMTEDELLRLIKEGQYEILEGVKNALRSFTKKNFEVLLNETNPNQFYLREDQEDYYYHIKAIIFRLICVDMMMMTTQKFKASQVVADLLSEFFGTYREYNTEEDCLDFLKELKTQFEVKSMTND